MPTIEKVEKSVQTLLKQTSTSLEDVLREYSLELAIRDEIIRTKDNQIRALKAVITKLKRSPR